jgi:CheY-like chemotaxis protein
MRVTDLKQLFGTAVKAKRAALRISQEELAGRSGLHRTYISDVERGARNLSLESIEKLAHALDLSVSGLFTEAGNGKDQRSVEILLVEDRADDIELTLRAFRKARFTNPTHVVRDGAEALDFLFATGRYSYRAEAPLPGVILLDLDLPKVSGMEVLRRIRVDTRTRRIPVVVLTVSRDYADAAECRQLGVETYLIKPVSFRSFSEVTPHLQFEWTLVKPTPETSA